MARFPRPNLPKTADKTWKKVVKNLHAVADWSMTDVTTDALGVIHLHLVLAPADRARRFGRVTRVGDLWMLTHGTLIAGESSVNPPANWSTVPGIKSNSDKEVSTWIAQMIYDSLDHSIWGLDIDGITLVTTLMDRLRDGRLPLVTGKSSSEMNKIFGSRH